MITLYLMPESPPCRAVQMAAAQMNVDLQLNHLDLSLGEHLTQKFASVNPYQVVPTIVVDTNNSDINRDTGTIGEKHDKFTLWESRAILKFLVDYIHPGHSLYPSDIVERAKVDHLLYFDCTTLYSSLSKFLSPVLEGKPCDPVQEQLFYHAMDLFDKCFLTNSSYVTGNSLTIADISIIASLSFAEAYELDFSPWPRVQEWIELTKTSINNYKLINAEPMVRFTDYMRQKKKALLKKEPVCQ